MQKMMTYSEANVVLGSSLTPDNRCITKAVAIANDAAEDPLTSYASNRLVPASAVEPGGIKYTILFLDYDGSIIETRQYNEGDTITDAPTPTRYGYAFIGWDRPFEVVSEDTSYTAQYYTPDVVTFFVDESGNKIDAKEIFINVAKGSGFIVFRTKTLVDGNPPPIDYTRSGSIQENMPSNAHYEEDPSSIPSGRRGMLIGSGTSSDGVEHDGHLKTDGTSIFYVKLSTNETKNTGWDFCELEVNLNVDNIYKINSRWPELGLKYNATRSTSDSFSISEGFVKIEKGGTYEITVVCNNDWEVTPVNITYETPYKEHVPEADKYELYSSAIKLNNSTIKVTTSFDVPSWSFNLYQVKDLTTNEVAYFGINIEN